MTDLSTIKLFATQPHPCSYLEEELATTVFVDPQTEIDTTLYSRLSELGFRRSGAHLYRPRCAACQACVPLRIPVDQFTPTRNQKRCLRRNADLVVTEVSTIDTDEHYELYANYIEQRHADGDMYPPSRGQYRDFLSAEWEATRYLEFRLNGTLLGLAVSDRLDNGLSAIYTFYSADDTSRRSLGVYAVLHQIALAKQLGLPYVYLGYWIKRCQKMSYKSSYRPFQLLIKNRWVTID